MQRQFMSLVGQYDMDLFTTIFSLLYVPVIGLSSGSYDPLQVRTPFTLHYRRPCCTFLQMLVA